MKRFMAVAVLAVALMSGACTRVEPGYAGIVVNNYGDQKGVEDFPVQTGRIWYNPITKDVYKFPTFAQQVVWTADKTEGSAGDDSITFSDRVGVTLNADVSLVYTIRHEKVPHLFVKFRQGVDHITNVYMRTKVREAFNTVGSRYEAIAIVGSAKSEFQAAVKTELERVLAEDGIIFDTVSMVGAPRLNEKVQAAINSALEATQRAIRAENEVREREAEAQKRIADAEGEAEAIRLKAEAEAQANLIVAASISRTLVEYEQVKKWDGKLPQVTGGVTPLLSIGGGK